MCVWGGGGRRGHRKERGDESLSDMTSLFFVCVSILQVTRRRG